MKEKVFSLTGDDFTVKTVDGIEVCKCHGKVMSIKDKKKFTDTAGKEIFMLKNKMLSVFKSFHGESPDGHDFEVKVRSGSPGCRGHRIDSLSFSQGHFSVGGSKSTVNFKNFSDNNNVEIEVHVSTQGGAPDQQGLSELIPYVGQLV